MGTHCVIAIKQSEYEIGGEYHGTYVHYDGFPEDILEDLKKLWKQGDDSLLSAVLRFSKEFGYYSSFPSNWREDKEEKNFKHLVGKYEWNYLIDLSSFSFNGKKEPVVHVSSSDQNRYLIRLSTYNSDADLESQDISDIFKQKKSYNVKMEDCIKCPYCRKWFNKA